MLVDSQIQDIFQSKTGRMPTPVETQTFRNAGFDTIASIGKSNTAWDSYKQPTQQNNTDVSKATLPTGGATMPQNNQGTTQPPQPTPTSTPAEIPTLTAYKNAQTQVQELDKTLQNAYEERRAQSLASGGIVNEAQLKSMVAYEKAPLLQQRAQLVANQGNLGKQYQMEINSQKAQQLATTQQANLAEKTKAQADSLAFKEKQLSGTQNIAQQRLDLSKATANQKNALANAKLSTAKGSSLGASVGLSPEAIDTAARNYAVSGAMPTFGMSKDASKIKMAIMNRASELAIANADTAAQKQIYTANTKSISTLQASSNKIESVATNLTSQFDRLGQLAKNINKTSVAPLNTATIHVLANTGNPDAAAYLELLTTMQSDYAAMQAAVAGSKGGVYFAQSAGNAIPAGKTPEQYKSIYNTLVKSSQLAKQSIQGEIGEVQSAQNKILKASSSQGQHVDVAAGSVINYQGKKYNVDAQGNMTAIK